MPDTPEGRLQQLGIVLPEQLPVLATYRLARRHRDIVYLAGHVSATLDGSNLIRGKAGAGLTLEQAQQAARNCALHMLSTLRAEIGSLDQVAQILKVFGMVNVAPGFADGADGVYLASVLDGCANQLTEIRRYDGHREGPEARWRRDLVLSRSDSAPRLTACPSAAGEYCAGRSGPSTPGCR